MMDEATMDMTTQAMGEGSGDEQLFAKFYDRSVEDAAATLAEGRPIFKDVIFLEAHPAGQEGIDRKMRETDKQRFPRQWDAYNRKLTEEESATGTPLREWSALTRSQVDTLMHQKVFTVEQLANVADGAGLQVLGLTS